MEKYTIIYTEARRTRSLTYSIVKKAQITSPDIAQSFRNDDRFAEGATIFVFKGWPDTVGEMVENE